MWEERDRQEQAQLAGHANAPVTAEEEALPGACCSLLVAEGGHVCISSIPAVLAAAAQTSLMSLPGV